MSLSLSLILPAYNEERTVLKTVTEAIEFLSAMKLSFEIIVVADGTDATREKVVTFAKNEPRVRVLGSTERRGKGRGVKDGVEIAQGRFIGFADADNKTPISEYAAFHRELEAGARIVIGNRKARSAQIEKKQALYRQLGSLAFNRMMNAFMGLKGIEDTQCGFKFFDRDTAREIFNEMKTDGYMFDVEILYLAARKGIAVKQLPVRWRDDADSRLDLVRGNLKNLREILRIRLG